MNSPNSDINTSPNEVRRFIIENQPVRGSWVDLEGAWRDLRAHQHYSRPVQDLLGEAVSASVLLAATLKFDGTLTLQLEGKGDVRLLVAQCTNDFRVRGVARLTDEVGEDSDKRSPTTRCSKTRRATSSVAAVIDLGARNSGGSDPFASFPQASRAHLGGFVPPARGRGRPRHRNHRGRR